jgi:prefoldin subunit 5
MREKILIFLVGLLIGLGFGYAWRMTQVEPVVGEAVDFVYKQNQRLTKDLVRIELRLTLLEDRVGALQQKRPAKEVMYYDR